MLRNPVRDLLERRDLRIARQTLRAVAKAGVIRPATRVRVDKVSRDEIVLTVQESADVG